MSFGHGALLRLLLVASMMFLGGCAFLAPPYDDHSYGLAVHGALRDDLISLNVRDEGKGRPILLLHGFAGSTFSWYKIQPVLARTHRVIAVDMKGFGQSDKPMDGHYSLPDQARLISQLIEKLDLKDLTIVGHSMGGGVALLLGVDAPASVKKRIRRIVMIESPAFQQKTPTLVGALTLPVVSHVVLALTPPELLSKAGSILTHPSIADISTEEVLQQAKAFYEPGGKYAIMRTARQIGDVDTVRLEKAYRTLAIPLGLIWCRDDDVVPLSIALRLRRTVPRSDLLVLDRCRHAPHYMQPEKVINAIRRWATSG